MQASFLEFLASVDGARAHWKFGYRLFDLPAPPLKKIDGLILTIISITVRDPTWLCKEFQSTLFLSSQRATLWVYCWVFPTSHCHKTWRDNKNGQLSCAALIYHSICHHLNKLWCCCALALLVCQARGLCLIHPQEWFIFHFSGGNASSFKSNESRDTENQKCVSWCLWSLMMALISSTSSCTATIPINNSLMTDIGHCADDRHCITGIVLIGWVHWGQVLAW